jgi:hypothetical protein
MTVLAVLARHVPPRRRFRSVHKFLRVRGLWILGALGVLLDSMSTLVKRVQCAHR